MKATPTDDTTPEQTQATTMGDMEVTLSPDKNVTAPSYEIY